MPRISASLALIVSLSYCLSGCGEEQPLPQHAEPRSGLEKPGEKNWLTAQDDVKPEIWLIEHETKSGAKPGQDAGEVRRSLAEASAKFNDTPRMIANRAVQLETMLRSEGGEESAIVLIGRLNDAVAPGRIESFGAAGQQYYNMRKAGFTDTQALDELTKRYGSRS